MLDLMKVLSHLAIYPKLYRQFSIQFKRTKSLGLNTYGGM